MHLLRNAFVGRQPELVQLQRVLDDALEGRGSLVMLGGEPGIGKTHLAQVIGSRANAQGALALWGRCPEDRGAPPYWPWMQQIRSYIQASDPEALRSELGTGASDIATLVAELGGKLPDLQPTPLLEDPQSARFRLIDAVISFWKRASQNQPLVLFLDDLHQADDHSLGLLESLTPEVETSRILIVGTYRDVQLLREHPLGMTLGGLTKLPNFQRVVLEGLGREETGVLIEALSGLPPVPDLVQAVHRQTGGNPLFASEVIRLLLYQGKLGTKSERDWEGQIPSGVREVINRLTRHLSPLCLQVMSAAATIGREFDLRILNAMLDEIPDDHLLAAVDEGLNEKILESVPASPGAYRFRHALFQQVLLSDLPLMEKSRLHARIGDALETIYGQEVKSHAAELAFHYTQAEAIVSPAKVVKYSVLAGEGALKSYGHEEALAHFRRGLSAVGWASPPEGSTDPVDAERAEILVSISRAHAALRQDKEALATLSRAFDYYVETGDLTRAVAAVDYPYSAEIVFDMVDLLEQALSLAPLSPKQRASLLSNYGFSIGQRADGYERAAQAFDRALTIAEREQDATLEIRLLSNAAQIYEHHRQWHKSIESGLRALALAKIYDDPVSVLRARLRVATSLCAIGEPRDALLHGKEMLSLAETIRDRSWARWSLLPQMSVAYLTGDWETAGELIERWLALDTRPEVVGLRALLDFQRGEFDEGRRRLDRVLESSPAGSYIHTLFLAPIAHITGEPQYLREIEADMGNFVASGRIRASGSATTTYALALTAVLRGDSVEAERHYNAVLPHKGTNSRFIFLTIDRLLGLLARTIGESGKAVDHFESAIEFCRKAGYRPELAWTCHDYAEMILSHDATDDEQMAASLIQEGIGIADALGMKPLTTRLMVLKERVNGPGVSVQITQTYPGGLTPREAEILGLVSQGRSNREIAGELHLSIRTVERHINNIYNKIGVHNRAEATAFAILNKVTP